MKKITFEEWKKDYEDAKKFEEDGFIPDHLADDVNWNGGEDGFDLENTTYWRKN